MTLVFLSIAFFLFPECQKKASPSPARSQATNTATAFYPADHPDIQYTGRIDFTDPKKPKFSAPGVYIQSRFKGTSCTVLFKDQHLWGKKNYYSVIIDDTLAYKITPLTNTSTYTVATNLKDGVHTVTFVKRTEANIGTCEFLGFRFKEIATSASKPLRKMEFIGNSISCGSGIEAGNNSAQCNEDGWGQPYHNNYFAFGPVLARKLNAQYHTTAVSGIGLYRNYSNQYDARTMPQVYDLLYLEQTSSPKWDINKYIPDAIVIELGTNDFSPGDNNHDPKIDSATYVNSYVAFVNTLRDYYPNAHIFCISSPMLGDGWPTATDKSATNLKNALAGVENYFRNKGDTKVHKFYVKKVMGAGCGTHPDVAEHAGIANELEPYIKSVMGW